MDTRLPSGAKDIDVDGSSRSSSVKDADAASTLQQQPNLDSPLHARAMNNGDVEKQHSAPVDAPPANHVNNVSTVPNGGARAWLQVAGAFFLFFNTWGIVNTFGVYNTFYIIDILKNDSPSTIAWIGSIQAFLLVTVGMITGPIYDMGYFRPLIVVGSFLVVFGHMMLSLCTTFWQVLLAQAFCIGIGAGCLFIPSVAILSTYFTSHLAIATGIAASGSSLGGVIYPVMLYRLLPRIGFPWAVRTIGFLSLATLILPNLCMKVRVLPPARRKLIDVSAFKNAPFMLFSIGAAIAFTGLFQPFFFLQSFAIEERITSEDLAFYLLAILNAASVFGRVVPNFVADKVGPMNVIIPCCLITGITTFCFLSVHNLGGIVVNTLFFGFFSGSLVSLPPTVVVSLTQNRAVIGTRLGMCFAFVAIGVLIGGPIGGELLRTSGFSATWIFGGALTVGGGFIILLSRLLQTKWTTVIKA